MTSWTEEWRDIPGYAGIYQVSNRGGVRRSDTLSPRQLKPWSHPEGYLCVTLSQNGKRRKRLVHRLVAEAFNPNPEAKPQINHLNGNKRDNRAENLEWCDNRENALHSAYILRNESQLRKRPVRCINTGRQYASATEAARSVGGCSQNIVKCCKGQRNHTKGLAWAYAEEVQP